MVEVQNISLNINISCFALFLQQQKDKETEKPAQLIKL